jgi:uncharacterized protein YjbI with pentapeptide repeats
MTEVSPAFAAVRPRVSVPGSDEPRLLDEVVAELIEDYPTGILRIAGGCGAGKTTALAHLAAVFAHEPRFQFLDEPTQSEIETCSEGTLIVVAMPLGAGRGIELVLEPWGKDELIEYLLTNHPDACASVISRLGASANSSWVPEVACAMLDSLVANRSLQGPMAAIAQYVNARLAKRKQWVAAAQFCLAMLVVRSQELERVASKLAKSSCPTIVRKLLRHQFAQLPLAAQYVYTALLDGDDSVLTSRLPYELVQLVGGQCRENTAAIDRLLKILSRQRASSAHAMAASILLIADPTWRPEKQHQAWQLSGGVFRGAKWSKIDLSGAQLRGCDFSNADLSSAILDGAFAAEACFDGANLRGASLMRISANQAQFRHACLERARLPNAWFAKADFYQANMAGAALMMADLSDAVLSAAVLKRADLSQARLVGAQFEDADLEDAVLRRAQLSGVDLRQARLDGASFEYAVLKAAQLEDVQIVNAKMRGANLDGAHLTGSSLHGADLRDAELVAAGLAEINWESANLRGANLRNATFHLGSSRSGLVGSPIACEGSRTGFYTDDTEDLSFKRPDEVRKANLRGADLRRANLTNVDFYLVDLRQAQLDAAQREQARQTGAILEDSST